MIIVIDCPTRWLIKPKYKKKGVHLTESFNVSKGLYMCHQFSSSPNNIKDKSFTAIF
jgi:hypothetical protein